ncbi:hypothetical protein C8R44DRAFT_740048 [Mycena epipterygia]|nr:hypothetical protein C8R44DRAFT_740048 [Mycena epipterygia]
MSAVLKACNAGLQQSFDVFKVQGARVLTDMADMQRNAHRIQQEVLQLISSLPYETSSDRTSSISRIFSSSQNSSNSLSMLPSEPKIFHGRESEVSDIPKLFSQESPRIAILGAGGMGKTSRARAVLHHHEIAARYEQQHVFVACDTVSTQVELVTLKG